MKFKNLFQFYFNYKAQKLREKAIKLALKSNSESNSIIVVAERIEKYIKSGSL